MTGRRAAMITALAGACLVVSSRWLIPAAPALYDGIQVTSPEPYHYASPPPDLSAGNKPPTGVDGDIKFSNGTSLAHAIQTPDNQLLVSFNDGALSVAGVSQLHIHIASLTQPPPAPPHSTYVGNVYEVIVTDFKGSAPSSAPGGYDLPAQPAIVGGCQALLRLPPLAYNNVRLYYDGAWHDIGNSWGAQSDFAALSPFAHLGLVAAFNDEKKAPVKPKPQFPIALFEVALTVFALGVIAAGILVQLRRQRC